MVLGSSSSSSSSSSKGGGGGVGGGGGELTWREKSISGCASYILPLSLLGKI